MEILALILRVLLVILGLALRLAIFVVLPILFLVWLWQQLFGSD
jgi:hypothetical protein